MSIKKAIIILIVLAVASLSIFFFVFNKKSGEEYTTEKVERGNLIQTVSETGVVKAAKEINLNFSSIGKVEKILVKIGDKVEKDQVIAELDYSALLIKEKEAQASLNKVVSGATSQDIAVAQASVSQAESSYYSSVRELEELKKKTTEDTRQAENNLNNLLSESSSNVTSYEQAVSLAKTNLNNAKSTYQKSIDNNKSSLLITIEDKLTVANAALDAIDRVLKDDDAKNLLSVQDLSYLNNTKTTYSDAQTLLLTANSSLSDAKISNAEGDIKTAANNTLSALNKVYSSLNYCFGALERSVTSSTFTQSELDAFKTSISANSTSISTAISSVQTGQNNLDSAVLSYSTSVASAEQSLAQAEANLSDAILVARNTLSSIKISSNQQITSYQAKVDSSKEAWDLAKAQLAKIKAPARNEDVVLAQSALDSVKKQIEGSIIKAPINGTITKINYEVGEQSMAGNPAVVMLGENNFEIEVLISEADITKIGKENVVEITLDAFGDDVVFGGKVFSIEPAETVIQDVIYYKVIIEFDKVEKMNIKSGMTANITIFAKEKRDVLMIPGRAVIQKVGNGKIVRVLSSGKIEERSVETGLRGDDGVIEILFGLEEGEEIVTFIKEVK